ncbi:MAG TPA: hypothetical protein VLM79_27435 [Kofleriaceae bacterium]|nr:hypothetical protein [Kofleriaceae bacterium]
MTIVHPPTVGGPALPTLRTITTPWTPYALVFSRDGGRLAIGGGAYNGRGGVMLVDHASGHSRVFSHEDLPQLGGGAVSGLCFSADARHLVASSWGPRQRGGRVVVFEVDGLELRPVHAIELDYSGNARFVALASGVALHQGMALVRNHRGAVSDLVLKVALPDVVHRGAVQPSGSQRLLVIGDRVVTGNHGELEVIDDPHLLLGLRQYGEGRIVVASIDDPGSPEVVDVEGNSSITALARAGDRLITGGRRGELDAWSLDRRWQRQRIRDATRREPPSVRDLGLTSTYLVDSIVDVCAIPHGGAASVSIGGELCLLDAATAFASHAAPGPGSPRSLAAHPDGGALAVGVKQRGIHAPRSIVAIVDLRAPIEDAWRTPVVRSLAQAASRGDAEAFVVLADALETAGGSAPLLHHLRHHDHALTSCWVVDALVAE